MALEQETARKKAGLAHNLAGRQLRSSCCERQASHQISSFHSFNSSSFDALSAKLRGKRLSLIGDSVMFQYFLSLTYRLHEVHAAPARVRSGAHSGSAVRPLVMVRRCGVNTTLDGETYVYTAFDWSLMSGSSGSGSSGSGSGGSGSGGGSDGSSGSGHGWSHLHVALWHAYGEYAARYTDNGHSLLSAPTTRVLPLLSRAAQSSDVIVLSAGKPSKPKCAQLFQLRVCGGSHRLSLDTYTSGRLTRALVSCRRCTLQEPWPRERPRNSNPRHLLTPSCCRCYDAGYNADANVIRLLRCVGLDCRFGSRDLDEWVDDVVRGCSAGGAVQAAGSRCIFMDTSPQHFPHTRDGAYESCRVLNGTGYERGSSAWEGLNAEEQKKILEC